MLKPSSLAYICADINAAALLRAFWLHGLVPISLQAVPGQIIQRNDRRGFYNVRSKQWLQALMWLCGVRNDILQLA